MDSKESVKESKDQKDLALKRVVLSKVVIMAPALLSLVKHCQDKKQYTTTVHGQTKDGASGKILGYIEE